MRATTDPYPNRMALSMSYLFANLFSLKFFEVIGAAFGILGTTVLSLWPEQLFLVFVFYAISNAGLLVFSSKGKHHGIFAMTAVYTVLTVNGLITNWP